MNNDKVSKFLPIWVWVIVVVQVALVLFFSAGTAMSPGDFMPDVTELNYVTQLYITRNITVALGLIIALFFRSHQALLVLLIVRVLTDIFYVARSSYYGHRERKQVIDVRDSG